MKKDISAWNFYQEGTDEQFATKEITLGPWSSYSLMNDPKHLAFVLSRYKFCAKMLEGMDTVVEIGCGDGVGLPIIAQVVNRVYCLDWDERNLEGCSKRLKHLKNVVYEKVDLNEKSLAIKADAAFSIDVIEHLEPVKEANFMKNVCKTLKQESVLITGTPNKTAAEYATERSEIQHINLKTHAELKNMTRQYFKHVFMFGMNDEVLHTGYGAMCHYLWSLGAGKIA